MNRNSYDALYQSALQTLNNFETKVMGDSYIEESSGSSVIYLKARYTLFSSIYTILLSEYERLIDTSDKEIDRLLNIIGKDNMSKVKTNTVSKINTLEDALYILHRSALDLKNVTIETLVSHDTKLYVPTLVPHKPDSLIKIRAKLLGANTDVTITNLGKFKQYISHLSRTFHTIKDIKSQYKAILDHIEQDISTYDQDYKILIDRSTQYFSRNIDIIIRISIDIINTIITVLRNIVDSINKHRINEVY